MAANLALLQSAAQANFSNPGSAHLAQSSPVAPQAPTEATSYGFYLSALGASLAEAASPAAPSSTSSESPKQDHHLPSGFFGAFMATPAELSLAPFHSDGSSIRMVVDSGGTDNFLDPELTPGVRARMPDIEILSVPKTIVAADKHLLKGVETGIIFGAVTDNCGNALHVSFRLSLIHI